MELYDNAMAHFDDCLLLQVLESYLNDVILRRAESAKQDGSISRFLGTKNWTWKTRTGNKKISLKTKYGVVWVRSIQVKLQGGKSKNLTRKLLGLEPFVRIPPRTQRVLANLAQHCRYRAAQVLASVRVSLQSISRAVMVTAGKVYFEPNPDEQQVYHGDGTGASVKSAGKGYETQLLMQEYYDGSMHPVATQTCLKGAGWRKLLERIARFGEGAVLIHDGDTGIEYAFAKGDLLMSRQICMWHLYHSVKKSTLYADFRRNKKWTGAHKKELRGYVLTHLYNIVGRQKEHSPETVVRRLKLLATKCKSLGLASTATYLRNAAPISQTTRKLGIRPQTTSKTERAFRTINDRTDPGSWWSPRGADAIVKLRLDWYYNRSYLKP